MQVCWVVPDVSTAIDSWVRSAGVGPFFRFDGIEFTDARYRGRSTEFPALAIAIAYAGDLQIELVCQDNDDTSVFRDLVPRGRAGLHHIALVCQDYETDRDAYTDAGAELAFEGVWNGSRVCYVDTSPTLGIMVELLESNPALTETFAAMRAAAETWDGKTYTVSF
ncbi:hypothetical protein BST14_05440 [Mycobacterium arosiense ATCC BAA-1401 = DSM 45069]|uniref:Glyoxalase n=2 Tax=Mycobacterium arosiense TaxID=425468 RepID=A0A1W9ZNU6_MYCAI|nr:hypothetical protein BST14_05440 [Mycobacterium arosiense ATCC BAA-1401 = DSM 45069]